MAGGRRLTEFGKAVRTIMQRRDVYQWADLHRSLTAVSCPLSRQQVMNYVYGDSVADERFVEYLEKAFNLSEEERYEISYAWAYLQNKKGDTQAKTALQKVAENVGWSEEVKRESAYRFLFSAVLISA